MAIRPIVIIPDDVLRTVAAPVQTIDKQVQMQIDDMFETMYDAPGIGLAAPQIGLLNRVIVVDCAIRESREQAEAALVEAEEGLETGTDDGDEGAEADPTPEIDETPDPIAMINPEILSFSEETAIHEEGCLSIPEYYEDVERPARCKIRYLDRDGKTVERDIEGLLSVCVQHEIDHLDGKLFIDYLSRLKRERVVKKFQKAAKRAAE